MSTSRLLPLIMLMEVFAAFAKVNVVPQCGRKFMTVELHFDNQELPNGRFIDWIVVGTTNKPQCRLKGNGELHYVIDIAVVNDPCGTKMTVPGTLENRIRIGKSSLVILQGDESLLVRCVYGLPEVDAAILPSITPSFNVQPHPLTPDHPLLNNNNNNNNDLFEVGGGLIRRRTVTLGLVHILLGVAALLVLICLLIGCSVYVCLRRHKTRKESRKRVLVAIPPSSELGKLGLGHLWWSGKAAVSNDALLNHDYAVTGKELPGVRSMISSDTDGTDRSGSCSPSAVDLPTSEMDIQPKSYSQWRREILAKRQQVDSNVPPTAMYTQVNKRSPVDLNEVQLTGKMGNNRLKSIAEIRNSVESDRDHDRDSISTLEGKHYTSRPSENTTAEIHSELGDGEDSAGNWKNLLGKCLERYRGFGPRKLTEQEIGRWRHLVADDDRLCTLFSQATTRTDLESIVDSPGYRPLFPTFKWMLVLDGVEALIHNRREEVSCQKRLFTTDSYSQMKRTMELRLHTAEKDSGEIEEVVPAIVHGHKEVRPVPHTLLFQLEIPSDLVADLHNRHLVL